MTPRAKRNLIDFLIFVGTGLFLSWAGVIWWALPILAPFSLWNYYDGMTRHDL